VPGFFLRASGGDRPGIDLELWIPARWQALHSGFTGPSRRAGGAASITPFLCR